MADEKIDTPETTASKAPVGSKAPVSSKAPATPKSPAKRRVRGKNRLARWFREMRSELKKVVWPTPKQIMNNTIVSLSVMAASAVAVWALDFAAGQIFQAIRTLAGR